VRELDLLFDGFGRRVEALKESYVATDED